MSEALIRLSQIINCMESAGKVDNPASRHRILAQYREEASWHIRVLEEQEVERERQSNDRKQRQPLCPHPQA